MISPAQLPLVHKRLSARGHNAGDLAKVFGLNHMRIARAVWAA
jgi:microsomal dipeptidase-like Zn-dependent dipeptidase